LEGRATCSGNPPSSALATARCQSVRTIWRSFVPPFWSGLAVSVDDDDDDIPERPNRTRLLESQREKNDVEEEEEESPLSSGKRSEQNDGERPATSFSPACRMAVCLSVSHARACWLFFLLLPNSEFNRRALARVGEGGRPDGRLRGRRWPI